MIDKNYSTIIFLNTLKAITPNEKESYINNYVKRQIKTLEKELTDITEVYNRDIKLYKEYLKENDK